MRETSDLKPVDDRHHIKLSSPLWTLETQLEPPVADQALCNPVSLPARHHDLVGRCVSGGHSHLPFSRQAIRSYPL